MSWVLSFLRAKDGHIQNYIRLDYDMAGYPGLAKAEFLVPAMVNQLIELLG